MNISQKVLITNNRLYDRIKYFAQIILPALGALYFALSEVWGLSYGVEVVGTIAAIDTFLGVVLKASSTAYSKSDARFDGSIDVLEKPDGGKTFSLVLNNDPEYQMEGKDEILFKVNKNQE